MSEIDKLLESLFRNGVLNTKKDSKPTGTPSTGGAKPAPTLEWDPAENIISAQNTVNAVEEMSASLNESIEKLTQQVQADMAELDVQLKEDGVEHTTAANPPTLKAAEEAFETAKKETAEIIIGQDDFINALCVAFKRPFVTGREDSAPMGKAAILGGRGTGKRTSLETMTASLGRQGVLKSGKLSYIDLSRYGDAGTEKVFIQDFYAALKSGTSGIVFTNFEGCHTTVLSLVSELFRTGQMTLSGRYAEQKGMLVEIGSALVPNSVSTLSAGGKYLFLLSEKSEGKIVDALGMPFLSSLDDICETEKLSEETVDKISERILTGLCKLIEDKLSFKFTYDEAAVKELSTAYARGEGVEALEADTAALYRLLSEVKLKQDIEITEGKVTVEESELVFKYETAGEQVTLRPKEDAGAAAKEAAVEEVKKQLAEIVGLEEIKKYILSLEDNFKIQQLRREKGLKSESPSMHMIFTGNPGTGKTTVARIVSRYLKAIGVLTGGQLVEVTRADLVGQYVGHTAPLTAKAIQSALGGVLFVDEAYSLYRGKDDSFGLEAIDTLVKGMEDHRDELVVILAGYSHEMETFLTANSGLKSRFPNIIEFPDYTGQELLDITKSIVKGKGYRIDESCEEKLLEFYDKAQREGDPRTNGNGRMARNKVEDAILNCSGRNMKLPPEEQDLELLTAEDFELE